MLPQQELNNLCIGARQYVVEVRKIDQQIEIEPMQGKYLKKLLKK